MSIRSELRKVKLELIDKGLYPIHGKTGNKILMYHGVSPSYGQSNYSTRRFLSSKQFEDHLLNYMKHYNVVTQEAMFKGETKANAYNVALTFDDGYMNNLTHVIPLLEKYQIHATFYITAIQQRGHEILWADYYDLARNFLSDSLTIGGVEYNLLNGEYIDSGGTLLSTSIKLAGDFQLKKELMDSVKELLPKKAMEAEYKEFWQLMGPDEIRKASESPYVTIGSHCVTHNNLGNIKHDDAVEELKESKAYLENITQQEVDSMAYPDGSYTRELVSAAYDIGYKYQLAVKYLFEEDEADPCILDRYSISDSDRSWNTFNYYLKYS